MDQYFTQHHSSIHFIQSLPSKLFLKIILNKFFVNHPIFTTFHHLLQNITINNTTFDHLLLTDHHLHLDNHTCINDEQKSFINSFSCAKKRSRNHPSTSTSNCTKLNIQSISLVHQQFLLCSCFTCKYKWMVCLDCLQVLRLSYQKSITIPNHHCIPTLHNDSTDQHINQPPTQPNYHHYVTEIDTFQSTYDSNDESIIPTFTDTQNSIDFMKALSEHYNRNNILTSFIVTKFALDVISKYLDFYSSNQLLDHLILQASYQNINVSSSTIINPKEKKLFIHMVYELINLPKGNKTNLGNIISLIKDTYEDTILSLQQTNHTYQNIINNLLNCAHPSNRQMIYNNYILPSIQTIPHTERIPFQINIPSNDYLIRKIIFEGKYSFLNNLPTATVQQITNSGYAYISIIELLFFNFHFGLPFKEHITPLNNQKILPLLLWSDSFVVGNPLNKGSRSSVKALNCAILNYNKKLLQNQKQNVFNISLGSKYDSHYVSFTNIFNELILLQTYGLKLFSNLDECIIFPKATVYVVDRVEHNEISGFSSHSSTYGKIPTLSCPIQLHSLLNTSSLQDNRLLYKDLYPCTSCQALRLINSTKIIHQRYIITNHNMNNRKKEILQNYKESLLDDNLPSTTCINCYDFNFQNCEFKPDANYPFGDLLEYDSFRENTNGIQRLISKEINFQSMKRACRTIYYHCSLYDNNQYNKWKQNEAKAFSQVECISTNLFNHIWKISKKHKKKRNKGEHVDEPTDEDLFQKHPILLFSNQFLQLNDIHVGVMHTIFENATKHIFELLWSIAKAYKNIPYFYQECNIVLNDVKQLSLSQCKTMTLSTREEPLSKYLAENYVGIVHIIDAIGWKMHPFLPEDEFKIIMTFLILFQIFVTHVMDNQMTNNIDATHSYAKLCLEWMYKVEKIIFGEISHKLSKIETTSSFVYFLTIASAKQKYGNLRRLWEGGEFGEGSIKHLKKNIRRGIQTQGTLKSVLSKIQYEKSLQLLYNDDNNFKDDEEEETEDATIEENLIRDSNGYSRYRKYFSYKDRDTAIQCLNAGKTMNFIFDKSLEKFFILLWGHKRKRYYSGIVLDEDAIDYDVCDFNYNRYLIKNNHIIISEEINLLDMDLGEDRFDSVLCYAVLNRDNKVYYKLSNLETRNMYDISLQRFNYRLPPFSEDDIDHAINNINVDSYL